MAFQLATAFVRIGVKGLSLVGRAFMAVKNIVMGALGSIGALMAKFAGVAGGVGLGVAIKLGSDAEEMQGKFNVVFEGMTQEMEKFAKKLANDVGRSINDVKSQMAEFQDVLLPIGFAADAAGDLSKEMTQVAIDLASFNNKSDAQAANAVKKAILGENEMLKDLGVVVKQADVKQRLFEKGQRDLTGSALKQATALATLELITEGSASAMGDAARTAGSFANRLKGMTGAFKDLGADIGSAFLPALANIAHQVTLLIRKIQPRVKEIAGMFARAGQVLTTNWDLAWKMVKTVSEIGWSALKDLFFQIPEVLAFMMGLQLKRIVEGIKLIWDTSIELWDGMWDMVLKSFKQGWENVSAYMSGRKPEDLFTDGDGGIFERIGDKMGKLGNAFGEGFSGGSILDVLKPSQDTLDKVEELKELTAQLKDEMKQFEKDPKKDSVKNKPAVVKKLVVEKMEIPTGMLSFAEANAKVQESLLKSADGMQKEMVGELKEGNNIAQKMEKGIDKMNKGISSLVATGTGAGAAAPVAFN